MLTLGMPSGSLNLDQFPAHSIEIHCPACDRRGRYAKARLVERFGAGFALPDLLHELSPDCPARIGIVGTKACGAIFPALRKAFQAFPAQDEQSLIRERRDEDKEGAR